MEVCISLVPIRSDPKKVKASTCGIEYLKVLCVDFLQLNFEFLQLLVIIPSKHVGFVFPYRLSTRNG